MADFKQWRKFSTVYARSVIGVAVLDRLLLQLAALLDRIRIERVSRRAGTGSANQTSISNERTTVRANGRVMAV